MSDASTEAFQTSELTDAQKKEAAKAAGPAEKTEGPPASMSETVYETEMEAVAAVDTAYAHGLSVYVDENGQVIQKVEGGWAVTSDPLPGAGPAK